MIEKSPRSNFTLAFSHGAAASVAAALPCVALSASRAMQRTSSSGDAHHHQQCMLLCSPATTRAQPIMRRVVFQLILEPKLQLQLVAHSDWQGGKNRQSLQTFNNEPAQSATKLPARLPSVRLSTIRFARPTRKHHWSLGQRRSTNRTQPSYGGNHWPVHTYVCYDPFKRAHPSAAAAASDTAGRRSHGDRRVKLAFIFRVKPRSPAAQQQQLKIGQFFSSRRSPSSSS